MSTQPELLAKELASYDATIASARADTALSETGLDRIISMCQAAKVAVQTYHDHLTVAQRPSQSHACLTCCGDGKVSSGYSNRPYDECPDCNGTGRGLANDPADNCDPSEWEKFVEDRVPAQCAPQPSGEQVGNADAVRELVRSALEAELGDAYDCTRVWEAWNVGTMAEDDFTAVTDRLDEIVETICAALSSAPVAGTVSCAAREALEQIAARVPKKHPRGWKIICPVCGYKSVEPDTEARHAPNCAGEIARAALASLPAAGGEASKREADLLEWLDAEKNLELSFERWEEDGRWQVHEIRGGRNDQEWSLLGRGDTPEKALFAAKIALGIRRDAKANTKSVVPDSRGSGGARS